MYSERAVFKPQSIFVFILIYLVALIPVLISWQKKDRIRLLVSAGCGIFSAYVLPALVPAVLSGLLLPKDTQPLVPKKHFAGFWAAVLGVFLVLPMEGTAGSASSGFSRVFSGLRYAGSIFSGPSGVFSLLFVLSVCAAIAGGLLLNNRAGLIGQLILSLTALGVFGFHSFILYGFRSYNPRIGMTATSLLLAAGAGYLLLQAYRRFVSAGDAAYAGNRAGAGSVSGSASAWLASAGRMLRSQPAPAGHTAGKTVGDAAGNVVGNAVGNAVGSAGCASASVAAAVPPAAAKPAFLRGLSGEYAGAEISLLPGQQIFLGSDPAVSSLVFSDPAVSRQHLRIRCTETGCIELTDLSANGTCLLDGRRLSRYVSQEFPGGATVFFGNRPEVLRIEA